MNAYTEDNEILVINTCPDTEVDPLSMMFWWKAVDPGDFLMGSEEYWKHAELGASSIPRGCTTYSCVMDDSSQPRSW